MTSSLAYVALAGLYLLGAIVGIVLGCHAGETIGRRWGKPIPGLLIGAGAGGTIGLLFMYALTRFAL